MPLRILLLSATEAEIAPLLREQPGQDILITGVGAAPALWQIAARLANRDYDLVIQAGIAGCFPASGLEPGQVVQVVREAFGDLGAYQDNEFIPLRQLGLSDNDPWIDAVEGSPVLDQLPQVSGITVNTVTDDAGITEALWTCWQPGVESMEGAAAALACRERNIPFMQLRGISNYVGIRDKRQWHIQEAITAVNRVLLDWLPAQMS